MWLGAAWWLLGACSAPVASSEAPPPAPAATAPAAAGPPVVYVTASKLNLREAPGGAKVGSLEINSPLEVLETRGPDLQVRVANGRTGWVPAEFTSPERLSVQAALQRVAAATTAADRLAWAQRAAALDDRDRNALRALAAASRETGDEATAARLDRRLAWPDDVLLAGAHHQSEPGRWILEWSYHYETPNDVPQEGVISDAAARRRGLSVGQEVWVLPERSPAVVTRLVEVRHGTFNECGGSSGFTLVVEGALPSDERPVAFTIRRPPASWQGPAPTGDVNGAIEAVREAYTPPEGETEYHAVPYGDGVWVRAATLRNRGEVETGTPSEYEIVDHQVDHAGNARRIGDNETWNSFIGYGAPWVGRDLDGDDRLDLVLSGGCQVTVFDADGELQASTESLCCGC